MSAVVTERKTYADLCAMPEDGNRYELIGGEIVGSPAPTWMHQEVLGRLTVRLRLFVENGSLGVVGVAPLDIHLSPNDTVQPDLVFVRSARLGILTTNGTDGPPDLVVEVLSPSTQHRDEGVKLRLYEAAGIPEYWVADVLTARFRPYTLTPGGYRLIRIEGTTFRSLLLPGFELDVVKLFLPFP